jgi:hypothetical protein
MKYVLCCESKFEIVYFFRVSKQLIPNLSASYYLLVCLQSYVDGIISVHYCSSKFCYLSGKSQTGTWQCPRGISIIIPAEELSPLSIALFSCQPIPATLIITERKVSYFTRFYLYI